MPPQSSAQKAAIASFVSITGASERIATRFLKNAAYKLDAAIDTYFQSTGSSGAGSASVANKEAQLTKAFDSLRNDKEDTKDVLGADSSMKYLQSLGVNIEDASLFIAMELFQAPSIGEIPRAGFVNGWKEAGVDAKPEAQKAHFRRLIASMPKDRELFRKVYRYTFVVGKEGDQRSLTLDNSIIYWDMLFKEPGQAWVGQSGTKWLDEWSTFLRENWERSVNRDMWNQTLEFALKSIEDESLGFWNEDGAWPGVIDDFVAWYKRKSEMDVDA
ncbi:Uu.00g079840.m01.CDS01 [Anthostomella pinea]|uniref:Defective in cullin neddylation protein n=1 Tax=Anthostomella pinea TaxID=933095 RepID=A0AAI8YJD9_9PEZI|nr:Uu.00g079840.m01.CDS01 [Anthostomella pinea]